MPRDPIGLCRRCLHAQIVRTPRSEFWLCGLSRSDVRFERYPRLPVLACEGFEPGAGREPPPEARGPRAAEGSKEREDGDDRG